MLIKLSDHLKSLVWIVLQYKKDLIPTKQHVNSSSEVFADDAPFLSSFY